MLLITSDRSIEPLKNKEKTLLHIAMRQNSVLYIDGAYEDIVINDDIIKTEEWNRMCVIYESK